MNNRIEQLDSIRGAAAFTVFLSHLPLTLPIALTQLLKIMGLINGHGAVMLFFVLSGFVLSMPYLQKKEIRYIPYIIKRIFRIYIPYLVAITFAIILFQMIVPFKINGISKSFDVSWNIPLNVKLVFEHIYLIGNIHSDSFNTVIWSLIHELRISLIFPLLVLLVKRLDWKVSVLCCFMLSGIAGINNILHLQNSNGFMITYFDTINYLSIFILGSVLAKHRNEVVNFYQTLSVVIKISFLIVSLLSYNFSNTIVLYLYNITGFKILSALYLIIVEHGMSIGAIGFIIIAMGSSRIANILMKRPISFLGKISFSLYLYHFPILLTCIYLFYDKTPLWIICIAAFFLSIAVSSLAWHYIEKPSNKLGREIAGRVSSYSNRNKKEIAKDIAPSQVM